MCVTRLHVNLDVFLSRVRRCSWRLRGSRCGSERRARRTEEERSDCRTRSSQDSCESEHQDAIESRHHRETNRTGSLRAGSLDHLSGELHAGLIEFTDYPAAPVS